MFWKELENSGTGGGRGFLTVEACLPVALVSITGEHAEARICGRCLFLETEAAPSNGVVASRGVGTCTCSSELWHQDEAPDGRASVRTSHHGGDTGPTLREAETVTTMRKKVRPRGMRARACTCIQESLGLCV